MTLRTIAKRSIQAVSLTIAFPFALASGFGRVHPIFVLFGQAAATLPGFAGDFFRAAYYRLTLRQSSIDTVIAFGSFFSRSEAMLEENVSIGAYCVIGRARIGARTQISSHVEIPSGQHQHARDAHGKLLGSIDNEVQIGPDCWIGAAAVVMANVGAGTTIGAGSVVVKSVPAAALAVGNPARVIRIEGQPVNSQPGITS